MLGTSADAAHAEDKWDQLVQCEASGDWDANTGNGFYGGLQFTQSTWEAFGGTEYAPRADLASPSQQKAIAEKVLDVQGWNAWPACSEELGLSGDTGGYSGTPSSGDSSSASTEAASTSSSSGSSGSSGGGEYTVQSGDTLSSIASSQGVDGGSEALYEANQDVIEDSGMIHPGQELTIPA